MRFSLLALLVACSGDKDTDTQDTQDTIDDTGDPVSLSPALTAINVPVEVVYSPLRPQQILVEVVGEGLDPTDATVVEISLLDALEGAPVEVVLTNTITLSDVAVSDGIVAIDVFTLPLPEGDYEVCAEAEGLEALDCVPLGIREAQPSPCEIAFHKLQEAHPDFGCRCDSGDIRRAATESPDGTLGTLSAAVGGNTLGAFDDGNLNKNATVSSLFKFEPHFTVEIVNDPGMPEECSEQEWAELAIGLCSQGQDLNKTLTLKLGTPDEQTESTDRTTGDQIPYDPRPEAEMRQDGWGYTQEATSGSSAVTGKVKSHDAPNIIHWLDAPGMHSGTSADWLPWLPVKKEHYFHSYVHGTTGRDEDSCDCYFSVTSVVLNADGSTGVSTITDPDCR